MSTQPLTRRIAWAAATDAGDRSMRAGNRRAWNMEDCDAAVAEFNKLWPVERELASLGVPANGSERRRIAIFRTPRGLAMLA